MEVVRNADGDNAGVERSERESRPVLVFIIAAKVDGAREPEVSAAAEGVDVVCHVGETVVEVIDSAAVHDLCVGDERSAGDEDARADFVGPLVDGCVRG